MTWYAVRTFVLCRTRRAHDLFRLLPSRSHLSSTPQNEPKNKSKTNLFLSSTLIFSYLSKEPHYFHFGLVGPRAQMSFHSHHLIITIQYSTQRIENNNRNRVSLIFHVGYSIDIENSNRMAPINIVIFHFQLGFEKSAALVGCRRISCE